MTADFGDFDSFLGSLGAARDAIDRAKGRALYRAGALVKDTAVRYAPKSPTTQERKRMSKATKAQWAAAKARRSARSTSRDTPGGLMRSIQFKATKDNAEIFVAANSEAGRYAFAIHELKGKTWKNRGVGTIAKGSQADDKFITRAIKDREEDIFRIMEHVLSDAISKL